jgi:cell division septation protein DedD
VRRNREMSLKSDGRTGRISASFLGLIVAGSVVIFVLGVMVGGNVRVPPEAVRQSALPAVDQAPTGEAPTVPSVTQKEIVLPEKKVEVKGTEMTFYESLEGKEEPRVVEEKPAEPPKPPVKKPPAPKEPPPAKAPPAKAPPPPTDQVKEGPHFAVQVMALKDQTAAKRVVKDLSELGFDAYLDPLDSSGGRIHRIRVGRMATRDQATVLQAELRKFRSYKDAYVVKQ